MVPSEGLDLLVCLCVLGVLSCIAMYRCDCSVLSVIMAGFWLHVSWSALMWIIGLVFSVWGPLFFMWVWFEGWCYDLGLGVTGTHMCL